MKIDSIGRILDGIGGVRKDGGTYLVPEELDLSVFVGLGAEVLTIPRVTRLTPTPDLVTIDTVKGDRLYFPPDFVVGMKTGVTELKGPRATGFR